MPKRYNAIVIGAGPAGETCAAAVAQGGRRVAIVEKERVGGECAFWACVPLQTLLRATILGLPFDEAVAWRNENVDYYDDAGHAKYLHENGIDLIRGSARISSADRIQVDATAYACDDLVIATGSRSKTPDLSGLRDGTFWDSRDAATAESLPEALVILGGGPVSLEIAQAFARFGSRVTVVEEAAHILPDEEPEMARLVTDRLCEERVQLQLRTSAKRVDWSSGNVRVSLDNGRDITGSHLMVAIGRTPQTANLGTEVLGDVCGDDGAVRIDERCRVIPHVYAIGDVTGVSAFTHSGKYQARIAAANILGSEARSSYQAIPRCVFTDPEFAAVGLTEKQAAESGVDYAVAQVDLEDTVRPNLYDRKPPVGMLKLVADAGRKTLIGASLVSPTASEMITAMTYAIKGNLTFPALLDMVEPYPTFSECFFVGIDRLSRDTTVAAPLARRNEAR